MTRIHSFREPGQRYTNLRVIAFLSTLIGVLLLIAGVALLGFGLYGLATAGDAPAREMNPAPPFPGPQVAPVPSPLFAGFYVLWACGILFAGFQLVGVGAFLRLMIHVEENTRASAQILDGFRARMESHPEEAPRLFTS